MRALGTSIRICTGQTLIGGPRLESFRCLVALYELSETADLAGQAAFVVGVSFCRKSLASLVDN